MDNPLFRDGKPDINAIRQRFGEHGSGRINHTTRLQDTFSFAIQRNQDGSYHAVIMEQPGYRNVDDSPHASHRLPGPNGFKRVCFKREPQDLPTVVALTLWWAECTSKYIRDGGNWN